jgi:DNA-binding MarR family transcriptional regulator
MTDRVLEDPSAVSMSATGTGSEAARVAARAAHMMGAGAAREWHGEEAMAWEGLIDVNRRLRRGADELLIEQFDLSISMLGIIGRLSLADELTLRQTALAQAMGLSLSRVSRVLDLLEQRGLTERRSCPSDARATNVRLTRRGLALTARAQAALFDYVQSSFFAHLEPHEVQTLATVFARLLDVAPGPGETC